MGTAQAASPRTEPVSDRSDSEHQGLPVLHVTDADTDLEVLRSVPKQFAITDDKTANWLVKRIQQSRHYAERVKEWAELELRRAAREEATLLWVYGRQLEQWAKDEIAKFNGRRKSLALPAATVGFRTNGPKIVVDDEAVVLAWARSNLPSAVVTVEKLAKSVVNEHAERTGELPDGGVHVEPAAEKFYIR